MKTLLLGDICPTWVTAPLFKKGNVEELFTDVMSIFKNKDFVFANLECALTDSNNAIKKFGPNLKAPVETAEVMKKIGITCVGLSNNHIFDFGKEEFFRLRAGRVGVEDIACDKHEVDGFLFAKRGDFVQDLRLFV